MCCVILAIRCYDFFGGTMSAIITAYLIIGVVFFIGGMLEHDADDLHFGYTSKVFAACCLVWPLVVTMVISKINEYERQERNL